jgi:vesicle coat complex subunit
MRVSSVKPDLVSRSSHENMELRRLGHIYWRIPRGATCESQLAHRRI